MERVFIEGNAAIAEAAIRAGVEAYFGYPITPQTEVLEHLARRMPELGRVFLQAESEVASINMVYGAACAGVRAMTSSSSPGISLMQEGLSYIACSEVPAVIINIMRGGPGLGNVQPAQGDYFQAVKSAGHGDFRMIVLAPANVQEAVDLTVLAFDLADKYRTICVVLADGAIGQMMEPAVLPPMQPVRTRAERPAWALQGAKGRKNNVITSLYLNAEDLEHVNDRLQAKLAEITRAEVRFRDFEVEDADVILVGFGTTGRICQTVVREARDHGLKVGLHRPISLWPFPSLRLGELAKKLARRGGAMLVAEMNAGQMVEDVRLAVAGVCPVEFYGRTGGVIPLPEEIYAPVAALAMRVVASQKQAEA